MKNLISGPLNFLYVLAYWSDSHETFIISTLEALGRNVFGTKLWHHQKKILVSPLGIEHVTSRFWVGSDSDEQH